MLNKIHKEMNDFTVDIKTIKNHEELLGYMNSNFYASIKLLIAVSRTFSIYWIGVLPFIVSLSALLILSTIPAIAEQLHAVLSTQYILAILLSLIVFKLVYILHCKKYFVSCIEKSKMIMEKDIQAEV